MSKFNYRFLVQFTDDATVNTKQIAEAVRMRMRDSNDLSSSIAADIAVYPEDLSTHSGFFVSVGYAYSEDVVADVEDFWKSFVRSCWTHVGNVGFGSFSQTIMLEVWNRELDTFHRFYQEDELFAGGKPPHHFESTFYYAKNSPISEVLGTRVDSNRFCAIPQLSKFDGCTGLVIAASNPDGYSNFAYTQFISLGGAEEWEPAALPNRKYSITQHGVYSVEREEEFRPTSGFMKTAYSRVLPF